MPGLFMQDLVLPLLVFV